MKLFRGTLASVSWEDLLKKIDVNVAWSVFKELFLKVLNKHAEIVERIVRGRDVPWLNNSIKKAIDKRGYYSRKAKQTGRENFRSTYKTKRDRVISIIGQEKAIYYTRLIKGNQSDPKTFWRAVKKFLPYKACQQRPKSLEINSPIANDRDCQRFQ